MRVGLVCPYDLSKPGGVQSQVLGLAHALEEDGGKVTILGPGLPEDRTGIDLGRTVSIPANRSVAPVSANPRVGSILEEAAIGLDLVHVHEPLVPMASLMALRVGVPIVATFHAAPGAMAQGMYAVLGSRSLRRLLGPHVRRITAVSRAAAEPIADDLEVTIVPNGVDLAMFDRTAERVRGRVAFLGRDERRKGLDVLLEAWELVAAARPDATLLVMGADRGKSDITWMGPVDDETKAATLATSSIHVAPNLGGESFGIILVEGMAAGTPVLASDLRAFREVGNDAVRYFRTGDPTDLAEGIIDLLADDAERDRLSRAGRERAQRFDWSLVASAYRSVYEEALS